MPDLYPGFAARWRQATGQWEANKTSGSALSLLGRLDYQRGLQNQPPGSAIRVVFSAIGDVPCCRGPHRPHCGDRAQALLGAAASLDEATYLTAVLNSNALLQIVQPLQARGEHNPRDFDKYVWRAPILLYDPTDPLHRRLVELGEAAGMIAAAVDLPQQ